MESLSLKNPDEISETDSTPKNSVSFSDEPVTPITPAGTPPILKSENSGPVTPAAPPPILKSETFEEENSPPRKTTEEPHAYHNIYGKYSPPASPIEYLPDSPPYVANVATSPYAPNSPLYAEATTPVSPPYAEATTPVSQSPSKKSSTPVGPITPEAPPPPLPIPIEKKKPQSKKIMDIYTRTLVSKKVSVEMKYIGINIKEILEKKLKETHEGKCIAEGYVKKNTIKIITYSSGKICTTGILYEVAFECYVCFPVEGQLLNCIATNITKAGIKATSLEKPSPFVVFISRDHQLSNKKFGTIAENDHFVARIIGQRFELNDPYISIIAEIDEKKRYIKNI